MAEATINIGRRPEPERFLHSIPSMLGFDLSISSGPSFSGDHVTSFDVGFDLVEENGDLNCVFCEEGFDDDYAEESMNFVTDLFESRQLHVDAEDHPNWEFDSGLVEDDLGFELGFGPGLDVDPESDSDEFEVNSGILGHNSSNNNDSIDDYRDGGYVDDVFGMGGDDTFGVIGEIVNENETEESEWEEVTERFNLDEREALNSVIDRIEDISVSSDVTSSSEDDIESELDGNELEVRNIEWEVLLAVNNSDRGFESENPEEVDDETVSIISRLNLPEDYVLAMEYDTLFGQLVETVNSHKGSPPASKHAVENLQTVVLKKEDVAENGSGDMVICAVCKDEAMVGEKVTKMPCLHLYHGECILPWLNIRNTCPVCRYELPTDDANYEKKRSSSRVRGGGDDGSIARPGGVLGARNNFELLP